MIPVRLLVELVRSSADEIGPSTPTLDRFRIGQLHLSLQISAIETVVDMTITAERGRRQKHQSEHCNDRRSHTHSDVTGRRGVPPNASSFHPTLTIPGRSNRFVP
jgi:hypothetical protein